MVKHELTNSTNKSAMKWLYLVQHRSRSNKLIFDLVLQSTYLAHSAHYLAMSFINRERIALLESKFHFQIEY